MAAPERLRVVHRRAGVALLGLGVLITAGCLIGLVLLVNSARQEVPRLEGSTGPLAEALQWPWERFPPVTEVERNAVHQDFQTGEPLFENALRRLVWPGIPESGPLRPASPEARLGLECGIRLLRQIVAPHPAEAVEPATGTGGEPSPEVEQARSCLADADRAEVDQWLVLYTRALLYLSQGNVAAAERDLRDAHSALPTDQRLPANINQRATVYEAVIYTHYALGQTLVRGGKNEPQARHAGRLKDAIEHFRRALWTIPALLALKTPGYSVAHALTFFALRPTRMETSALHNDLLAAYLESPGFHQCEDRPQEEPCGGLQQRSRLTDLCLYRDTSFCMSKGRAAGPFEPPFTELFRRFYSKDRSVWDEENLLWALSNAVDENAENVKLGDDPYLLYNLASLLIQQGEFEEAARHLDRASTRLGESADLRPDDSERISRLAVVGQVLAGRSPSVAVSGGSKQPKSSIRTLYERFYDQEQDPPVQEFAAGNVFAPQGQALLDRWLFIHRFRALLARGDFEGFSREYDRLMGEKDIPWDFFQHWHDQVLADFGARALAKAAGYEKQEKGNAQLIRRFLSENGSFPPEVVQQARGFWGWIGRRVRLWASAAFLIALWVGSILFLSGLHKVYRRTFVSAHHEERLADQPRSL